MCRPVSDDLSNKAKSTMTKKGRAANSKLLSDDELPQRRFLSALSPTITIPLVLLFLLSQTLPKSCTVDTVAELVALTIKTLASVTNSKSLKPVESAPFPEIWDEPRTSAELFERDTRIIWGYWDSGEAGLPEFCRNAVMSWQVRNPEWAVILISDDNFKDYVSMSDLPSTFFSLKVQHRSDLIRLAVLIRYGGVYLDASTLLYKSFDEIWDTVDEDKLMLTSLNKLPESRLDMYNNGLLMTRGTHNPVLVEWRRRMLEYSEDPAVTLEDMKVHPAFQRVVQHWDDPSLGVLGGMIPYHSNLWLLNDLIWYNEDNLSEHVLHLPKLRWGFYHQAVPELIKQLRRESRNPWSYSVQDPLNDPEVVSWSILSMFTSMVVNMPIGFIDEPELAQRFMDSIHILKFTSHDMDLLNFGFKKIGLDTTFGRIYRSAFNTSEYPFRQATLKGATPPMLVSNTTLIYSPSHLDDTSPLSSSFFNMFTSTSD